MDVILSNAVYGGHKMETIIAMKWNLMYMYKSTHTVVVRTKFGKEDGKETFEKKEKLYLTRGAVYYEVIMRESNELMIFFLCSKSNLKYLMEGN